MERIINQTFTQLAIKLEKSRGVKNRIIFFHENTLVTSETNSRLERIVDSHLFMVKKPCYRSFDLFTCFKHVSMKSMVDDL